MCVLRYNQSKRIKLGPIKNRNEFMKRNWKGISTKGFDWVGLLYYLDARYNIPLGE